MTLEQTLAGWTGPSSTTEKDKQDRTERMISEAIGAYDAFDGYDIRVYAKGSYPNQTNVRADSDVDIAVECCEVVYWEYETPGTSSSGTPYKGPWTPAKLRAETVSALKAKFGDQVDTSGNTAIGVHASSARVEADVVPCFTYEYRFDSGGTRTGTRVFRKNGGYIQNFPAQHLTEGQKKDRNTTLRFKQAVRIMKRVENAMVAEGKHREVPSFFVECLVYNCPNPLFAAASWTERMRKIIFHIWDQTQGDAEPEASERWLEVNRCKYLFNPNQNWSREDARDFAYAAWNYLGLNK